MAQILCFILLLFTHNNNTSVPKTVLDYYLTLPNDYFFCETEIKIDKDKKKKLIKINDIKNGYIEAQLSEGYKLQVTIFRSSKGYDVIAVSRQCGSGCMCNVFDLLKETQTGTYQQINQTIFTGQQKLESQYEQIDTKYKLPQFGTTILLLNTETNKTLRQIKWNGEKFD